MIWVMVILGIIFVGLGLLMAMKQVPTIGGPGMAWVLIFIGLLILGGAYVAWQQQIWATP